MGVPSNSNSGRMRAATSMLVVSILALGACAGGGGQSSKKSTATETIAKRLFAGSQITDLDEAEVALIDEQGPSNYGYGSGLFAKTANLLAPEPVPGIGAVSVYLAINCPGHEANSRAGQTLTKFHRVQANNQQALSNFGASMPGVSQVDLDRLKALEGENCP